MQQTATEIRTATAVLIFEVRRRGLITHKVVAIKLAALAVPIKQRLAARTKQPGYGDEHHNRQRVRHQSTTR